jgi:acetyltransferase-like isoleucine patch superfamily enzyme
VFKADLQTLQRELQHEKMTRFKRRVPLGDLVTDRSQNAAEYGFGEGTTCYDSVLVIGEVTVGKDTWIGPNVILDGSGGGLHIGENCTICAGAQIYTHETVQWALSGGQKPYEHAPTRIGSHCFIGPNAVIAKGVTVGDGVAVGALSFVNRDVPTGCNALGNPARIIPRQSENATPNNDL